ncbi:hypothetical protein DCCM_0392 [Desulfocucumis palustris]|uniref:Uncharacterized protein n=1 Tax=Desulfocucumis palustris TaxID=1898651 RepID=A0A2L2XEE5_9FIRM|nr:hypothetical protein DCCM_0392 [Desulfocucumis palustris]
MDRYGKPMFSLSRYPVIILKPKHIPGRKKGGETEDVPLTTLHFHHPPLSLY